ncbi:hypothetical protein [Corallococcus macrosporus]|uniref:Uncharacterized protein n=2 Tax=Myxococcaceae TaxID=31 RepID=A0A250K686_9BACT|nr:hypothetical protein [Corallococcus macrosporus]AEI64092.1 hypothetical protein LILAB_10905 [Corallococcus macrosporus]ATB51141.1 hypothetical protein MYMAC_006799 [Corallococcus macrosporus DSM 14697]
MPEKSQTERVKRAKRQGTTLELKPTDVHRAGTDSAHRAKKSGRRALGKQAFADRNVSPRHAPGTGLTAKSRKLPEPEPGQSSTSRRKTLPSAAAAAYRKEGRPKKTTGRGDTTPLKAGKVYKRTGARKTRIRT